MWSFVNRKWYYPVKFLKHFEHYFAPLCDRKELCVLPETQYSSALTELSEIFEDCKHSMDTHQRAMPHVFIVYVTVLACLPLLSVESRTMK
jgi:hypothetical protein